MTDAKVIGERAYPYYRAHPAAASIALNDGDALDAGSAIDIDSNINWLEYEGCRPLVNSLGGQRTSYVTALLSLVGYDDVPAPQFDGTYSTVALNQQILWGPNTCYRFGPFDIIADRVVQSGAADGRVVLRPIKMAIDLYSAVANFTSTQIIYAATLSPDRAALFRGEYLALGSSTPASGRWAQASSVQTLTCNIPVTPSMESRWPCRDVSTYGLVESPVVPVWLWFGVLFLNTTNTPCFINSMSAWEIRDTTE